MTHTKPMKYYRNSAQRAVAKKKSGELLTGITFTLIAVVVMYGGLVMGLPT